MHTTTGQVASWLGIPDPSQDGDPALILAVTAANAVVERYTGTDQTDASKAAATMLGARLYRRRNSADGVQQLTPDAGMRVATSDPDIARLLRIDAFDPPEVG